jgi:predicted transcriptional regulator
MGKIKRLPDSELEVMLIVWRQGEAIHTGEILQKLSVKKPTNIQAVQSTLNRLLGKEFIRCQKIGRLNFYTPLIDEAEYRDQETETFLEQMYHSSPMKLIAALLSKQAMSDADLREIRQLLEKGAE